MKNVKIRNTTPKGAKFHRTRNRYFHVSCAAHMIPNPLAQFDLSAPKEIPYIERPGHTYNVGRNLYKRIRRAKANANA